MIDTTLISSGEFLRKDLGNKGWKKPRRNDFRFYKEDNEYTKKGITGVLPKRSIARGEVHPSLSFLLLPRNINDFPPVFDTEADTIILWSWNQQELTGKGPRMSPGVAAIKDGHPHTGEILNLVSLFERQVEEFDPFQIGSNIIQGDLQPTRAASLGIIALLVKQGDRDFAFQIASKISRDVKRAIKESDDPEFESAVMRERFSRLFSYFEIKV